MAITQHNYEVFFIDYHEGRLSAAETSELMAFLAVNPDLKEEFDSYNAIPLNPDLSITYNNKGSLKKSVAIEVGTEDEMIIAYLEGDLSEEKFKAAGDKISKDIEAGKLAGLYRHTMLNADPDIKFPNPDALKRKAGVVFFLSAGARYAAAAVIVLLLGITAWFVFNPGVTPERMQYELATLETIKTSNIAVVNTEFHFTERKHTVFVGKEAGRDEITLTRMTKEDRAAVIIHPTFSQHALVMAPRQTDLILLNPADIGTMELAMNEEPKQKTLAGKFLSGLFNKVKAPFEGNKQKNQESTSGSFSLWDIAEIGVKGINAIGDHDYTLVRDYNAKGYVKGIIILDE